MTEFEDLMLRYRNMYQAMQHIGIDSDIATKATLDQITKDFNIAIESFDAPKNSNLLREQSGSYRDPS